MPTAISSLPIIKVRIRKIARRRKLTCSGKGKSKWQLTALLWLSASVYVDGRDGDFSISDSTLFLGNDILLFHVNCIKSL